MPECRGKKHQVPIAHHSDCTKFIICDQAGYAYEKICPIGLLFNADKRVCDFAANVDCGQKSSYQYPGEFPDILDIMIIGYVIYNSVSYIHSLITFSEI